MSKRVTLPTSKNCSPGCMTPVLKAERFKLLCNVSARSSFGFEVDLANVLADYSNAEELDPAYEVDRDHGRRPPGIVCFQYD